MITGILPLSDKTMCQIMYNIKGKNINNKKKQSTARTPTAGTPHARANKKVSEG